MSGNKLISIVLPVHNGAKYLRESINSCLSQTYQNWELIIVDDASTDETKEICKEYANLDPRVKYFRNEQNRKLPASLNIGFSHARGEYLTWTSDDNRYLPSALDVMAEALSAAVDIVYCDYKLINEEGVIGDRVTVKPPETLWEGNNIGCCFLYRRHVHETLNGYSEDLFLSEDYDFWLRAAGQFKFHAIHEVLYQYRFHASSLTFAQSSRTGRIADLALARNLERLGWMSLENRINAALRLLKGSVSSFHLVESFRYLRFALGLSPRLTLRLALSKLRRFGHKKAIRE